MTTDNHGLLAMLNEREAAKRALVDLATKAHALRQQREQAELKVRRLQLQLHSEQDASQDIDHAALDRAAAGRRIDQITAALLSATVALEDIDAAFAGNAREREIHSESFSMPLPVAVADVLTYQDAVIAAKAQVYRLAGLVHERDTALATVTVDDPRRALAVQREDLLASIALGASTIEDLATFDKGAASTIKAASAQEEGRAAADAEVCAARDGLSRRLAEARAELEHLEGLAPAVRAAFMTTAITEASRVYADAATTAEHARARLMGLREVARWARFDAAVITPVVTQLPDQSHTERKRLQAAGVTLF